MEDSVLGEIHQGSGVNIFYDGWKNGKIGAITDCKGNYIYRFIEAKRNNNGELVALHEKDEENPIVMVGIVSYWIKHRKSKSRLTTLFITNPQSPKSIREQFDSYTDLRYNQFKEQHADDPATWKYDWDYEFFCKYIVPHEMSLNKETEALYEFISDTDMKLVRSVMDNYIEYLKTRRTELGYHVSPELLVLRSIDSLNEFALEDLENFEISTIVDTLESEGYVKAAWVEGHRLESIRLLDKGRVYMKLLEKGKSKKPPRLKQLTWEDEKRCFKDAVIYVLELKNNEGIYLFENNTQWIAVYRFAVDSGIMYDVNDPEEPKDKSTPQYAVFENFLHNLQLDIEPPIRIPFKKDYIDKLSKNTYVRYNTHHPWSKDGITDPRSSTLYKELEGVYLTLEKKYNKLVRQAEKNIV